MLIYNDNIWPAKPNTGSLRFLKSYHKTSKPPVNTCIYKKEINRFLWGVRQSDVGFRGLNILSINKLSRAALPNLQKPHAVSSSSIGWLYFKNNPIWHSVNRDGKQ